MPMLRQLSLLPIVLLGTVGCAKFQVPDKLPWSEPEPEFVAPDKMEIVWTNAVLHKAGQPSTRGFGGRVVFQAEGQEEAVMVDGTLTVYAFANEDPATSDAPPEKKFIFPQDTLAGHQSPSMLGPSYSFWLPWDAVNGQQRQLSLIARFEDASGQVIMSQIAHLTLPGRKTEPGEATSGLTQDPYPVQAASYDQSPSGSTSANSSDVPRSTTIHVTPSFSRKILTPAAPNREAKQDLAPTATSSASAAVEAPAPQPSPTRYSTSRNFRPASTIRRQPHQAAWPRRLPPTPRTGWNTLPESDRSPDEDTESREGED